MEPVIECVHGFYGEFSRCRTCHRVDECKAFDPGGKEMNLTVAEFRYWLIEVSLNTDPIAIEILQKFNQMFGRNYYLG